MLRTGSEVPVELPLMPGSLSLSEVVDLQTEGDEQLKEGHDSQYPVAGPDAAVIIAVRLHTEVADASCPLGHVIEGSSDVEQHYVYTVQEVQALLED